MQMTVRVWLDLKLRGTKWRQMPPCRRSRKRTRFAGLSPVRENYNSGVGCRSRSPTTAVPSPPLLSFAVRYAPTSIVLQFLDLHHGSQGHPVQAVLLDRCLLACLQSDAPAPNPEVQARILASPLSLVPARRQLAGKYFRLASFGSEEEGEAQAPVSVVYDLVGSPPSSVLPLSPTHLLLSSCYNKAEKLWMRRLGRWILGR